MVSSAKLIAPGYAEELLKYIYHHGPKVCGIVEANKVDQQKLTLDQITALDNVSQAVRTLRTGGNSTTDLDMEFDTGTHRILETMNSRFGQSEMLRYVSETTKSFCQKMK